MATQVAGLIKETTVSRVWRQGNLIYKQQPRHMAQNEMYALDLLKDTEFAPQSAQWVDGDTISMEFVEATPITDPIAFMQWGLFVLDTLKARGLRHGDLTDLNIIPRRNVPIIIDWGQSRLWDDPREDKRPEGDAYWLRISLMKMAHTEVYCGP